MPKWFNKKMETFNDGILNIYVEKNRTLTRKKPNARYGNKTIGITRYQQARVLNETIDKLISIPHGTDIEQSDIVKIGLKQYKIKQIQYKFDTMPPCIYLSLENNNITYKDVITNV